MKYTVTIKRDVIEEYYVEAEDKVEAESKAYDMMSDFYEVKFCRCVGEEFHESPIIVLIEEKLK